MQVRVLRGSPLSSKDLPHSAGPSTFSDCGDFCGDSAAFRRNNFVSGTARTNAAREGRTAARNPHVAFCHARSQQFPAEGRKWRILQERDRGVARALSHFDRGAGVWAKLGNILKELRAIESRREPGDRMTWSRATLKRSLARLELSGILQRKGIRRCPGGQWGSRERTLHPEKLLPRECEPRSKAECEPLRFKDFELHNSRKRAEPSRARTARRFAVTPQLRRNPKGNPQPKPFL